MKIAYIGEHSPTGTYYRQRITVNQAEFDYINREMAKNYNEKVRFCGKSSLITAEQMQIICYGKPLDKSPRENNKIYLNLTQLHFIWSLFLENKRFIDANTVLYIKN